MNPDLFDDSPDPTPTSGPAPSTSPALSGHGDDGDDTTKKAAKLSPRAQKFLAGQRREFQNFAHAEYKLVMQSQQARERTVPVLARLLNKPHLGSWAELWPMVDGLFLRLEDCPYVFVLSGWCASAKELPGPPVAPSPKLQQMLGFYGLYGRASALAADYLAAPSEDKLDALWAWVRTWPRCFDAAVVDGNWTLGRIKKLAADEMKKLRPDLEAEFLFLDHRVFWFTTAPSDPASSWRDFFHFALGYHYLPVDFKNDLGPYCLTIRTAP